MRNASDSELELVQRQAFDFFAHNMNPANGLIPDKTEPGCPASIAATGLALACNPVAVERGLLSRSQAIQRTLATLQFLQAGDQGTDQDATGHRGFFYHFLDLETGRRAGNCELSTIDSTFLFAGALAAAEYFDGADDDERQIRALANALYERADWVWALDGGTTIRHGWTPEGGFLRYRWEGYDEALLLYILALASPTHPIPERCYDAWLSTYRWEQCFGQQYLYAGPMFTHQLSHVWIDFRNIQDAFMREKGIDYFENSRRATLVQREYAIRNPLQWKDYSELCWGITASDGPGPVTLKLNGVQRRFFGYVARGVPFGPDDGTVAPWSVVASLPFAPEIILPTIAHLLEDDKLRQFNRYGFSASYNPTFQRGSGDELGWISPWHYGLNQGPIVLMIENHRTDLLWRLMRGCGYIRTGLHRAGFEGGWLEEMP